MPAPPRRYSIPLESTPEFASRIGVIFGLFALVESHLFRVFSKVANVSESISYLALGSHISFAKRIELFSQVCDIAAEERGMEVFREKNLAKALSMANAIRNKYAHGMYGAGTLGSATLMTKSVRNPKASRAETITVSTLDEDILFFKRVSLAMQDYVSGSGDLSELSQAIQEARTERPLEMQVPPPT